MAVAVNHTYGNNIDNIFELHNANCLKTRYKPGLYRIYVAYLCV